MPTYRKAGDKKRVWRSNLEDREELIGVIGMEEFEANSRYDKYRDVDVPPCFAWLFGAFVELWNAGGEHVTWSEIAAYESVRDVAFAQSEVDLILKMKLWAEGEIAKLREDEDG